MQTMRIYKDRNKMSNEYMVIPKPPAYQLARRSGLSLFSALVESPILRLFSRERNNVSRGSVGNDAVASDRQRLDVHSAGCPDAFCLRPLSNSRSLSDKSANWKGFWISTASGSDIKAWRSLSSWYPDI